MCAVSTSPGSLEALRRANRLRVLQILQQHGQASRADITRATGLSRTAVSSLVGELVGEGVVVERVDGVREAPSPSGGRPPTLLTLVPSSGAFVGIDFGHDCVRVAVVDRSGAPLLDAREELDVDHKPSQAIDTSVRLVDALLRDTDIPRPRVLGAGVALSAPLRSATGAFASPRIFSEWGSVDVAGALGSRLGTQVYVGNDANLGALAEATLGAGRGTRNLVYVMLSAGVGAGLLLDGELYQGESGTAGELGHIVIEPGGQVCRCGNRGCLETVAGSAALTAALRSAHGPQITFSDLLRLLDVGDPAATRVVADAGRAVGRALAGICSMLDPGKIVIGGELAVGGRALIDGIRETLDRETSATSGDQYTVTQGMLGATAEVLGAAVLAMRSIPSETLEP